MLGSLAKRRKLTKLLGCVALTLVVYQCMLPEVIPRGDSGNKEARAAATAQQQQHEQQHEQQHDASLLRAATAATGTTQSALFNYNSSSASTDSSVAGYNDCILPVNAARLNKLIDLLSDKEAPYASLYDSLGLISFSKLAAASGQLDDSSNSLLHKFGDELAAYLTVVDGKVRVTDKFVAYLNRLSRQHSFEAPRDSIKPTTLNQDEERPVIVTAANSQYYEPMQATVYHVHQHFPDYKLVIYDLGLTKEQLKITKENCNCEVRKFDLNGMYRKLAMHVIDLKVFSWKPLIIQESLRDFGRTVIYIDSSVRFKASGIAPMLHTLQDLGLLTQFIELKLTCYTNPKMFEWFGETAAAYEQFYTIEANILLFAPSALSALLMRAWVACALDRDCIAPPGSSTGGCCGCHRYDQDAITIVSSFFFGHPTEARNRLPAYSFTKGESFWFEIRRYEGLNYFTKSASIGGDQPIKSQI